MAFFLGAKWNFLYARKRQRYEPSAASDPRILYGAAAMGEFAQSSAKNQGQHVECTYYKMTYFPNVPCKWDILFLFSTKPWELAMPVPSPPFSTVVGNSGAECLLYLHCFQVDTVTHTAFYPVHTDGSYPRGKFAGMWIWPHPSSSYLLTYLITSLLT